MDIRNIARMHRPGGLDPDEQMDLYDQMLTRDIRRGRMMQMMDEPDRPDRFF